MLLAQSHSQRNLFLRAAGFPPTEAERVTAVHCCRWDVVRPESSQSGDWEMVVSATRAIEAGEDAWLCYSAEPGSQFLLHYGFV